MVGFLIWYYFYIFGWHSTLKKSFSFSRKEKGNYNKLKMIFGLHLWLTDYCFLFNVIHYSNHSFWGSHSPSFGQWAPIQNVSYVLLIFPHLFLSTALLSVTYYFTSINNGEIIIVCACVYSIITLFLCSRPRINHFSKKTRFLLIRST